MQGDGDDDDDASDLEMLEASACVRRSSHWCGGDGTRMEELEDSLLELQAEVARLTEQASA